MLPAAIPSHRDGQKGAQGKHSPVQGTVKLAPQICGPCGLSSIHKAIANFIAEIHMYIKFFSCFFLLKCIHCEEKNL